ncbi:RluA family pseudouridine synthase [Candidatus Saccharibacteria bacterium]|nr:RluA family pseudouridine synthase [Candidatus Saccharibacteria bacterium]
MSEFRANESDIGVRADVYIAGKYPEFTRSSLEGLFDNHSVSIGGKPVKSSYKVRVGDKFSVDDSALTNQPETIELPILFEDDDVLVIDKPAGILTHSKGALNLESTVASFIQPYLDKDMIGNRAGIVHRLDRATSGVIITAKNKSAEQWLQRQFSTRKTKKIYLAIVEGELEPKQAIIDVPIARNPKKPQTFFVNAAGKPAQTQYTVIKTFNKAGKTLSLLELKPITGRTHQLRVHLAYIGHPIVGDWVYGNESDHMLLHAESLELTLPDRTRRTFSTEPPEYFMEFQANG